MSKVKVENRADELVRAGETEAKGLPFSANGDDVRAAAEKPAALMARVGTHLETTARARNQLPPVKTNRGGLLARLELWLKGRAGRATRWYAWEQVNFNSATHAALTDMLQVLKAFDARLTSLERARDNVSLLDGGFAASRGEERDALTGVESEPALTAEAEAERLQAEQRERMRLLLDEMRVSFKQLALEIAEAEARGASAISNAHARLDDLRRRIEELRALCELIP